MSPDRQRRGTAAVLAAIVACALLACGCKHCFREQRYLHELPAACRLAPDPGPCEEARERFYFDVEVGDCKPFAWGGCDGVAPFATLEECERACY